MAKRAASNQINHDNWDQEEEKEEPGVFKSLGEAELKNRVIKKARRTLNSSGLSDNSGSSASPFSAFSGFSSKSSSTQPNFSFFGQSSKPESTVFQAQEQDSSNGCAKFSAPEEFKPSLSSESVCKPSSSADGKNSQEPQDQDLTYFKMLKNLNESVLKWMQMHFLKNPCCNFCPVFNDYKNYVQQLEIKYSSKQASPSVDTNSNKVGAKTEWMRSSPSRSDFFKSEDTSNKQSSSNAIKDSEMDYGAGFASNTTNTSTFSFGIKSPTTQTSSKRQGTPATSSKEVASDSNESTADSAPFSFSLKSDSSDKSAEKPTFGSKNLKPFTFQFNPSSDTEKKEEKDKEEYVPPKNEFTPVSEEGAVYSKRCKLFTQKNNEYVDKGVGVLYLKPVDGKTQLLIRADTSLGNILLNIILSASLPMQRTGKNNVLVMCVPNPPLDPQEKDTGDSDAKKAVPLLIRVKTSEDADELLEMLNKYKS